MENVIVQFLNQKKEDFLQSKIKSELNKVKKRLPNQELEAEIDRKTREKYIDEVTEKYSLANWFDNVLKKAKPNVTTHPAKFTNAKIDTDTSQIFLGHHECDGYIKTGNVNLQNRVDVSGNSATNTVIYEIYELLEINLPDNYTVADKFKQDDKSLIALISRINVGDFEALKIKCLEIYYGVKHNSQTHGLIKQVYFPTTLTTSNYHLLSIKTASMLMYEVKNRIDAFDIWVEGKHIRTLKHENKICEIKEYYEVFGITEIGFSNGDFIKMGNYSYLNVKNKGLAYLLPSSPPVLEKRNVRLPKIDFFKQCLYRKNFQESFKKLHKLMQLEINNVNIRNAINKIISFIIDDVLFTAFKIRQYESGWSIDGAYSNLPLAQRIWLDDAYQEKRLEQNEWRDEVSQSIARWVLRTYKDLIQGAFLLGDVELQKINQLVAEVIEQDKEFFNA